MKIKKHLLLLSIIVAAAFFTQYGYAQYESIDITENIQPSTQPVLPIERQWVMRIDSLLADTLFETSQVGITIWDLTADSMLYSHNARQLMRPASTMKLLTAITALDCLGPVYRFTTSLYYKGTISQGRLQGDIICVGGMDPLFERRDMLAFVEALKQKGITSIR